MVCPHCGTSSAVIGRMCPTCGRFPPDARSNAVAGTLTPPPADSDSETRLDSSSQSAAAPAADVLTPGMPFGPRYRILRVLGAGGMGVVYEAWDEEVGLPVALKVIRRDVMADPLIAAAVEQRFKRELLLAREVTHRRIVVRIHDLGDVEGMRDHLAMPFIEGQSLAARLTAARKLPVPDALKIAEAGRGRTRSSARSGRSRAPRPETREREARRDGQAMTMAFGLSREHTGWRRSAMRVDRAQG